MKIHITIIIAFFISNLAFSQNQSVKDRMKIKIAYCHYPGMGDYDYGSTEDKAKTYTPAGIIETNYALFNFLEAGAYLGYSMYERLYVEDRYKGDDGNMHTLMSPRLKPLLLYGLTCNLQFFPLIFQRDLQYLDFYISSRLGGIWFADKNTSDYSRERSQWDYGIYGGIAVYPFKHWGLFFEYGYGNYLNWRTGFSLRF